MKKISVPVLAFFAIVVGLYPFIYYLVDTRFGLLETKPEELLTNVVWKTAFYLHISFGGIALLAGWPQFVKKWRNKYVRTHRTIGKAYVIAFIISGVGALYIAVFATGGLISSMGFFLLGTVWLLTTITAFRSIKMGLTQQHQRWMIYSYATCFAAVTLRIYLPLLTNYFGEFMIAYKIVAWLCWVPNLLIAHLIVRNLGLTNPQLQRKAKGQQQKLNTSIYNSSSI